MARIITDKKSPQPEIHIRDLVAAVNAGEGVAKVCRRFGVPVSGFYTAVKTDGYKAVRTLTYIREG